MEISVSELTVLFERIIEKLKKDGVSTIKIDMESYMYIPSDSWQSYNDYEVEMGMLSDDVDMIKKMIADKERPCTYVDFDRTSFILRAISEELNPING